MAFTDQLNSSLLDNIWDAKWITHPEINGEEIGLYLFKRIISLNSLVREFIINISADNRYILYVNGQHVCRGPSRGNLMRWRYETVDIAPYLRAGENAISVKVWNFGALRPMAQFSAKTGLIIQGNSANEQILNTNHEWKVMMDPSYTFYPIKNLAKYYVTGPGEHFMCDKHPWEWLETNFKEQEWVSVKELDHGKTIGSISTYGNIPTYGLYPSEIPFMESKAQSFSKIRKCKGIENAEALINQKEPLFIPPNSSVSILLDQGELTNAYTQLYFSKGKNSQITITYAESLFLTTLEGNEEVFTKHKGNRDVIKGKKIKGHYDTITCDGGINRFYEPLWWRTFRYVQLEISTKEESLEIQQFNSLFTGYPLIQQASFNSNVPLLSDIFRVGWQTQRLCAGESFVDCPFYEQLQYIGDSRIQGLITFYISGDQLLWRKAITDFYDSRLPIGITQSRYPSYDPQLIPTFSLIWITMLWDYMMHCDDYEFIYKMLPAVLDILEWFEDRRESSGLLGKVEGWNFVDWVENKDWVSGVSPTKEGKNSAVIGLQYVYTIQKAVELFERFNKPGLAQEWKAIAKKAQGAILKHCWSNERALIADTPEKLTFSQHANILAVLSNTFPLDQARAVIQEICRDTSLAQSSYYYKFYLFEAIKKTKQGELYLDLLSPWEDMLKNGLTTFMEEPEPSRSDCHAWSSSPLFYFFSLICGIEPTTPSFNKVNISPCLGKLEWINGKMPHRLGDIIVQLKKTKAGRIEGEVVLPKGMEGNFYWKKEQLKLVSGRTVIDFEL